MPGRCFLVYPLPSVADESFLALLFGHGVVARSIFAGFAARRFALVEICDETHAEAVHRALAAVNTNSITSTSASVGCASHSIGLGDLGSSEEDRTLGELFEAHNAGKTIAATAATEKTKKKNGGNSNNHNTIDVDSGKSETKGNCMAYFGRLHFRGTPLQITPSPIEIEELYNTGGHVPQRHPKGRTNMGGNKKPYNNNNNNNNNTEQEVGDEMVTRPANGQFSHKRPRELDAADHTPSVDDTPNVNNSHRHRGNKETTIERSGRTGSTPSQEACRRCGSTAHFTRHCAESHRVSEKVEKVQESSTPTIDTIATTTSATNTDEKNSGREKLPRLHEGVPRVKPRLEPQRPVVRTSKDQCKYCGSDLHLSRHCPSK